MRVASGVPGVQHYNGRQGKKGKKLIEGDDADANYAYYALHKLHIRPSEWDGMEENEKAFIIAAIQIRVKTEEKERKKAERGAKRKGR